MKCQRLTLILLQVTAVFFTACDTGTDAVEASAIAVIGGVTPPVLGVTRVTTVTETDYFTGTVTWDGNWTLAQIFAGLKSYTATIRLTAKRGFSLIGVIEDYFVVDGSLSDTNPIDSGEITVVFPATDSVPAIGQEALGGIVAYIHDVNEEQRGLIAAKEDHSIDMPWADNLYKTADIPKGTRRELGTGSANTDNIIALFYDFDVFKAPH